MVQTTLAKMSRNKAPGLDEWRVYELRHWKTDFKTKLAELLNSVEKTGKWPDTLPGPLGMLLPKGGSDEPLDRRPIWLMPMIYRIWATRRARDWAYWRICWEREGEFQGADALAWDVALASEAANSQGLTFGIVALDWKKPMTEYRLKSWRTHSPRQEYRNGRSTH